MRFIWLIFFLVACNPFRSNIDNAENRMMAEGSEAMEGSAIDEKNVLKKEELLRQRTTDKQAFVDKKEKSRSICRRFPACLEFCSTRSQKEGCSGLPAHQVISLWSHSINQYSFEQVVEDLEWISSDRHASLFLYDVDPDQRVMSRLIHHLSEAECPVPDEGQIYYSQNKENQVSLYLAHPEGISQGMAKVAGPQNNIHVSLYQGLLGHCLEDKKVSFLERVIQQQNNRGFFLGHNLLRKSCGNNFNCMRLAYCQLNLTPTWNFLEGVVIMLKQEKPVVDNRCRFDSFSQSSQVAVDDIQLFPGSGDMAIETLDESDSSSDTEGDSVKEESTKEDDVEEDNEKEAQSSIEEDNVDEDSAKEVRSNTEGEDSSLSPSASS